MTNGILTQNVSDSVSGISNKRNSTIVLDGLQGFMGAQGTIGAQGQEGMIGIQGSLVGVQGNQGIRGLQGFEGFQGAQGRLVGIQGIQGLQGLPGIQGAQGRDGRQGTQCVRGLQGFQGLEGWQGFQGRQGFQGFQGFQGLQGFQGFQGWQGRQGRQGPQGFQGFRGWQGAQAPVTVYDTSWLYPTTGNTGGGGFINSWTNVINSVTWLSSSTSAIGTINNTGTYFIQLNYCFIVSSSSTLSLYVMIDQNSGRIQQHFAKTSLAGTSGSTVTDQLSFSYYISSVPANIVILADGSTFTYTTKTGNASNSYFRTTLRVTKLN